MKKLLEMTTVGDRILILFIIISSIISIFYIFQLSTDGIEKYALVHVDGIVIAEIPLNKKINLKLISFNMGKILVL